MLLAVFVSVLALGVRSTPGTSEALDDGKRKIGKGQPILREPAKGELGGRLRPEVQERAPAKGQLDFQLPAQHQERSFPVGLGTTSTSDGPFGVDQVHVSIPLFQIELIHRA